MPDQFTATRDDVDAIAAWSVIRAARVLARRLAEVLAPLDLTPVEFGVLVQLAASSPGGLAQADLARAVGVRPQSMTALVTALSARDLIDRGQERGRGRRSRIALTDHGRTVLAEAYPAVRASNAWFGDDPSTPGALVDTLRPMLDGPELPAPEVP